MKKIHKPGKYVETVFQMSKITSGMFSSGYHCIEEPEIPKIHEKPIRIQSFFT
jgi:hypothetical protein